MSKRRSKRGYNLLVRIQAIQDRLDGLPNSIDNSEAIRELSNIVSDLIYEIYYLPKDGEKENTDTQ